MRARFLCALFGFGTLLFAMAAGADDDMIIKEVFVNDPDNPTSIVIVGKGFKSEGKPVVRLGAIGKLKLIGSPSNAVIEAELPPGVPPGDYLISVRPKGEDDDDGVSGLFTIGAVGPQGEKGDTGPQGPEGEKGDKGDVGATGPKGDNGDKGDKGDPGAQGIKGDTGPQGETGPAGPRGDKGDQGLTGPPGRNGLDGQDGANCYDGIGDDVADCIGPPGPKGDKGDTGPQGPSGTFDFSNCRMAYAEGELSGVAYETTSVRASCPTGYRVVSGGQGYRSFSVGCLWSAIENRRDIGLNPYSDGWKVKFLEHNFFCKQNGIPAKVTVNALCCQDLP